MVMDLVTGGELFDAVAAEGRLNEAKARLYFQQLVDGIHYCHTRRVYHRDLKPENLLLSGDKQMLKITDFGLSSIKQQNAASELLHTIMGSPHYIAPEVITSAAEGYEGDKVDVWASGVILFGTLAGFLPFDEPNTSALYKAIVHDPVQYPPHFSYDVIKLLRAMLQKNPAQRANMEQVKSFAWFKVDYEPAAQVGGGSVDREQETSLKKSSRASKSRRHHTNKHGRQSKHLDSQPSQDSKDGQKNRVGRPIRVDGTVRKSRDLSKTTRTSSSAANLSMSSSLTKDANQMPGTECHPAIGQSLQKSLDDDGQRARPIGSRNSVQEERRSMFRNSRPSLGKAASSSSQSSVYLVHQVSSMDSSNFAENSSTPRCLAPNGFRVGPSASTTSADSFAGGENTVVVHQNSRPDFSFLSKSSASSKSNLDALVKNASAESLTRPSSYGMELTADEDLKSSRFKITDGTFASGDGEEQLILSPNTDVSPELDSRSTGIGTEEQSMGPEVRAEVLPELEKQPFSIGMGIGMRTGVQKQAESARKRIIETARALQRRDVDLSNTTRLGHLGRLDSDPKSMRAKKPQYELKHRESHRWFERKESTTSNGVGLRKESAPKSDPSLPKISAVGADPNSQEIRKKGLAILELASPVSVPRITKHQSQPKSSSSESLALVNVQDTGLEASSHSGIESEIEARLPTRLFAPVVPALVGLSTEADEPAPPAEETDTPSAGIFKPMKPLFAPLALSIEKKEYTVETPSALTPARYLEGDDDYPNWCLDSTELFADVDDEQEATESILERGHVASKLRKLINQQNEFSSESRQDGGTSIFSPLSKGFQHMFSSTDREVPLEGQRTSSEIKSKSGIHLQG